MSNPFQSIVKGKPVATETRFDTDEDKYIITYDIVKKVKMTGKNDTDFIIDEVVKEVDRIIRQEYYDSNADEVGILNIINKVRLSGDVTLLNQTGRVSMPGTDKDALGRPVEDVVDVTKYQVDQVEALESYKKGAKVFESLDPELKKKLSFEEVAKLSDADIDAYIKGIVDARLAAINNNKAEGDKE